MSATSTARVNLQPLGFKANTPFGQVEFVKRHSLPPNRLGNPRRKPKGHQCTSAKREVPRREARSLDNSNQLATSCADWLKTLETPRDKYLQKRKFQNILIASYEQIIRQTEIRLADCVAGFTEEQEDELNRLFFMVKARMEDEAAKEKKATPDEIVIWIQVIKEAWKRFKGLNAGVDQLLKQRLELLSHLRSRQKTWIRLSGCQSEWIGFKAKCCTTALAVPIGCNHRLCFMCNSHRSERFRERVRTMFDRLQHPVFLTLTVPNTKKISKRTFSNVRKAWTKFRKEQPWIQGGIFSLETTYRKSHQPQAPWHVHAHVLIDSAFPLPSCTCGRDKKWRWVRDSDTGEFNRRHASGCEFIRFKRSLEWAWFLLTGGYKAGWRRGDFDFWFDQTERDNWRSRAERNEWQRGNRRAIDVRRVTDRKKAALEVLKYITKASEFAHIPEAVDEFTTATRGARMLQTFGSWYGFKFNDEVNTWDHLACDCGKNDFEKIGRVYREAVVMDSMGRWLLKQQVLCRGGT